MSEFKTNKISPRKGTTTTIGDSGDTIATSSGTTLDIQGTYSGINAISWDTTAKTADFTAEANRGYFINTTSGGVTITLPASPTAGSFIGIKDYALTAQTNNISIAPNGNKIQGSTDTHVINTEGGAANLVYVDSTQGWLTFDAAQASDIAQVALFTTATGGTVTTCGDYKIHTFTSPGTFCVSQIGNGPTNPAGGPSDVDYMVVAGGGGAGGNAAGGAGGFRESSGASSGCYSTSPLGNCVSALPISATAYPITVGAGGSGSGGNAPNGSDSVFSTITSAGGGGVQNVCTAPYGVPGNRIKQGQPGGSGGGIVVKLNIVPTRAGGSGNTPPVSPPQGNNGGSGPGPIPSGGTGGGSGGGGATAAGTATGGPYVGPGRAGGAGATTSISGSSTAYAGGGGGGGRNDDQPGSGTQPGGSGGTGGGGPGGSARPTTAGSNGSTNTGGGAGGGGSQDGCSQPGGSGGSGIVIIRYKYQ